MTTNLPVALVFAPEMKTHMIEANKYLFESLTKHGELAKNEWAYFKKQLSKRNFYKDEYLVHSGDNPGAFHYITKGLVKLSYPNKLGRIVIKNFAREGEMTGPLLAWLNNEESPIDIQAIEQTETLSFPSLLVAKLIGRNPVWESIVRGYVEELAKKTEYRALLFLENSPEERYITFTSEEPELCKRLALNQIADYLGITDVSLSRIRRRINNR
ncbi:MAG: Crp/Fnr family transcriptional regulator [Candidatus Thiodiazotropha sp. (ex Codakia rugifera)]|nr:Crp/Fnr family transcriptional regulator [Candidatus Thiodiazotropha sp. (ex Codakia rugifera)]